MLCVFVYVVKGCIFHSDASLMYPSESSVCVCALSADQRKQRLFRSMFPPLALSGVFLSVTS